jgi:Uma2 family endonuclease
MNCEEKAETDRQRRTEHPGSFSEDGTGGSGSVSLSCFRDHLIHRFDQKERSGEGSLSPQDCDAVTSPPARMTHALYKTTDEAETRRGERRAVDRGAIGEASNHTTIADLLNRLGGVSAARVRFAPSPGTATERDVISVHDRENRLFELVDGTLVEKVMGFDESRFALLLATYLINYLERHDLGAVVGADGMMKLFSGLVRIPDAAFISWGQYPKRKRRRGEIPRVVPDLVVEVLSKGNTPREMARKLDEYFRAGVRLVWYVDPAKRTVRVYTAREEPTLLRENQTLDGGDVLPGFSLKIREWFRRAERSAPR